MNDTQTSFDVIDRINRTCNCVPLKKLSDIEPGHPGSTSGAGLFANTPVFISQTDRMQIERVIAAIDKLSAQPAYQQHCLSRGSPAHAHYAGQSAIQKNTQGIFSGFDFHLTREGPRLIEINTNAGGAFITHQMIASHNADLAATSELCSPHPFGNADLIRQKLRRMIMDEWRSARRTTTFPAHLAIIDEAPPTQFLYRDMTLARELLRCKEMDVSIIDAAALRYRNGKLLHGSTPIDFVYNRLTDFTLSRYPALKQAWLDNSIVLSPSPRHHQLLADKRNLSLFCQPETLIRFGLDHESIDALRSVPATTVLDSHNTDRLWQQRRHYYFKPVAGYASRAVYRGSKLTHRVWNEIAGGGYVAQQEISPPQRSGNTPGPALKFDLRAYVYNAELIALVARMYRGQTTNFRTPAGGFAPVATLPDWACRPDARCC
jgi:hypothetical protein